MTENNRPAGEAGEAPRGRASPPLGRQLRDGLALLWQAHLYAQDVGGSLWDFALEADWLYGAELTVSDLRWLVAKGFAEHGRETSFYGDPHRSFRPGVGLNFVAATCFVLTPQGAEFAGRTLKEPAAAGFATASHPGPGPRAGPAAGDHSLDPARTPPPTASQAASRRPQGRRRNRHQIAT
jgi:hypothetical protein